MRRLLENGLGIVDDQLEARVREGRGLNWGTSQVILQVISKHVLYL